MRKLLNTLVILGVVFSLGFTSLLETPIFAVNNNDDETEVIKQNTDKKEEVIFTDICYQNLDNRIKRKEKNKPYEFHLKDLEKSLTKAELKKILPNSALGSSELGKMEIPVTWMFEGMDDVLKEGRYILTPSYSTEYKISDKTANNDILLVLSYRKNENQLNANKVNKETNTRALGDVVNAFSIKWKDTSDNNIAVNVTDNKKASLLNAELTLSLTKADIEVNAIEIRLPARIFTNRDGHKQGNYEIAFSNSATNIYFE